MSAAIPTAVRAAVRMRDQDRCVVCGAWSQEHMHRIRRREGGHAISNGIRGCSTCHRRCHREPMWAMERGYILSAVMDVDPTTVPVLTHRGWMLLDNEGGYEVIAPRSVSAGALSAWRSGMVPREG